MHPVIAQACDDPLILQSKDKEGVPRRSFWKREGRHNKVHSNFGASPSGDALFHF